MISQRGPSIDPWGTPHVMFVCSWRLYLNHITRTSCLSTRNMSANLMLSFLTCRHGDWQHGGVGPAGGGCSGESEGGHVAASPPSEREEAEQPNPAGSILRWHRQETLRATLTGTQRWDHGALVILKVTLLQIGRKVLFFSSQDEILQVN